VFNLLGKEFLMMKGERTRRKESMRKMMSKWKTNK
jgi:hypothetical protein